MCHFKKIDLGLDNIYFSHKGVLKWSKNDPTWFQTVPLPIPIPGVSKSLLPGGLKRGPYENYNSRFPEGVQKEEIQQ